MGKKVRSTLSRLSGQFWSSSQVEDKRAGKVLLDKVALQIGKEKVLALFPLIGPLLKNLTRKAGRDSSAGISLD